MMAAPSPRKAVPSVPRWALARPIRREHETSCVTALPVLMGARVYLPGIGSFTSVDPVIGGSVNQYGYCSADPINCADPGGKDENCKRVWRFKLCSIIWNVSSWRSVYVARDRKSHYSGTPKACSPKRWLPPWRSSRIFWEDTDSYRKYGIWFGVPNGGTAYVFIPWIGWS